MNAEELKRLSDTELTAYIQKVANSGGADGGLELAKAQAELNARLNEKAQRTHWSTVPAFWISLIAMIAACIAAYPVLFPKKEGSSQLPTTSSGPQQEGSEK